MALPAGRYGVTIEQLRKIRKLPVNTIEMINETQGGTARVENGTKPEAAINAGEQFWHGSILYTATVNIATTDSIVTSGEGANCTPSETITDQLADKLDTYASDPTQWDTTPTQNSTKPVTSGGAYNGVKAVRQQIEDTVGWVSNNEYDNSACTEGYFINTSGVVTENSALKYSGGMAVERGKYHLYIKYPSTMQISNTTMRMHGYLNGSWVKQITYVGNLYPNDVLDILVDIDDTVDEVKVNLPMSVTECVFNHAPVSAQKCDNSVIAPVEDGLNASQAYAVGSHFIRNGKFCTVTTAMAQGDAVAGKYSEGDISDILVYKAGDTISGNFICYGHLTGSSKQIFAIINLPREVIANGFNCTVNTIMSRGVAGYLIPNESAFTNYKFKLKYIGGAKNNLVMVIMNNDETAFSGTNNTPVITETDLSITFT